MSLLSSGELTVGYGSRVDSNPAWNVYGDQVCVCARVFEPLQPASEVDACTHLLLYSLGCLLHVLGNLRQIGRTRHQTAVASLLCLQQSDYRVNYVCLRCRLRRESGDRLHQPLGYGQLVSKLCVYLLQQCLKHNTAGVAREQHLHRLRASILVNKPTLTA